MTTPSAFETQITALQDEAVGYATLALVPVGAVAMIWLGPKFLKRIAGKL